MADPESCDLHSVYAEYDYASRGQAVPGEFFVATDNGRYLYWLCGECASTVLANDLLGTGFRVSSISPLTVG